MQGAIYEGSVGIVVLSAIVGYIVLSAFSVSSSPQEAMRRIIEQPQNNMKQQKELDLVRIEKSKKKNSQNCKLKKI